MKSRYLKSLFLTLGTATMVSTAVAQTGFEWTTVVNNNDLMPTDDERCLQTPTPRRCFFNSYNQPSVNLNGLVVIRARSRGGGGGGGGGAGGGGNQPTHGIYTRDMAVGGSPIVRILDRTIEVPQPNNLGTLFVETPSFPRIDMGSNTIATRGNHQPVWRYFLEDGTETRAGTTGIYTNPFPDDVTGERQLITGAAKLGDVPDFSFFQVPEFPGTRFEVFPGAPSVTEGDTIVFKGNYDVGNEGKTGVYFRKLEDAPIVLDDGTELQPPGGMSPVVLIANSFDTVIPGTTTVFGSTSPPSAAGQRVVFAGFDNEDDPTLGGIYLAEPLQHQPPLDALVSIGERVPGESPQDTFNGVGEGGAFDGRFVGFWGSWGEETKTVRLYCPTEGNRDRIDYCNQRLVCEDTGETLGDENSVCDDETDPNYSPDPDQRICYQNKEVPVNQGIFVHDIDTGSEGSTRVVAKTGASFDEFLFWNYSGKTPCVGAGHSEEGAEEDGEPARWRSSAFVAVSGGVGATYQAAFKARTGELVDPGVYVDPVDGIYLRKGPGQGLAIVTVLDTTMDGRALDPEAPPGSTITELGLEREGLRGDWLAVSAKMGIEGGEEEDDMAGIYLTRVPTVPRR